YFLIVCGRWVKFNHVAVNHLIVANYYISIIQHLIFKSKPFVCVGFIHGVCYGWNFFSTGRFGVLYFLGISFITYFLYWIVMGKRRLESALTRNDYLFHLHFCRIVVHVSGFCILIYQNR